MAHLFSRSCAEMIRAGRSFFAVTDICSAPPVYIRSKYFAAASSHFTRSPICARIPDRGHEFTRLHLAPADMRWSIC
jgi:hypothetical protein